ncbi:hypothetical protein CTEN210_01258 [Chaetoceros tenuissimus]|uniref:Circumsporozoite protein n=1 Tax=Chaetoceros tenuissimus TaxID=426638 RepID=A0AAD3CFP1_9STRA|nr:hypothetical protein CTEN210_01258 [Chaetoceros tenuissimus]
MIFKSLPLLLATLNFDKSAVLAGEVTEERRLQPFKEACTGILTIQQFEKVNGKAKHDFWLECETPSGKSYKVNSVSKNWIKKNFINGNKISGKNKLVFKTPVTFDPEKQSISAKKPPRVKNKGAGKNKNKKNNRNGGRDLNEALTKDERTVLVVRVVANNGETPQTVENLKEYIFDMDKVSMSSQFAKCSHNQVSFIPTTNRNGTGGVNIVDGIVTVTIDANVEDGDVIVKQKIDDKLFDHFKTNRNNLADHVMYIYPDGVMAGIAYANVNGVLSVYSGDWGSSLTATLHEIGHNLNLHHSGKAGNEYADESGAMGYSIKRPGSPQMCFNAAKSWQLGWYKKRHLVVDFSNPLYEGYLKSVLSDPNTADAPPMLIKLNTKTATDYYINFNENSGFNGGTQLGGNKVLVTTTGKEGEGLSKSTLQAELDAGDTYVISNFDESGEDCEITVNSISVSSGADVKACCGKFCRVTEEPSMVPSSSPSQFPSAAPSLNPSSFPSSKPSISLVPSSNPTSLPTTTPSSSPSSLPSKLPSDSPSMVLSSSPTLTPSSMPSSGPSSLPSKLPSDSPTMVPSSSPTLLPSVFPSDSPTGLPSVSSFPSHEPSDLPSGFPSKVGTTMTPSISPSSIPSLEFSANPSSLPSSLPSSEPSSMPTSEKSMIPSLFPSDLPSVTESSVPSSSAEPSSVPTNIPSSLPSSIPSKSSAPSDASSSPSSQSASPSSQLLRNTNDTCAKITKVQKCKRTAGCRIGTEEGVGVVCIGNPASLHCKGHDGNKKQCKKDAACQWRNSISKCV